MNAAPPRGVVFGLAAIRTSGLALPLGLHLGGNWIQASVLRLGAPADGAATALFTAPLTAAQTQAVWSPDLPAHIPYLMAITATVILVAFWRDRTMPSVPAGA